MNTNIWNSSQMAGTGGALKALTKNLANQLTLNRTEMKRVVARVISEYHGQGHVGDYNGHMFFVRPNRIDMTKQITHSKEAFDEMLHQKRMRSKKQTQRPKSGSHSPTYKLNVGDKPQRSLTGVIIDKNQLNRRAFPRDILVEMSKPAIRIKSKPLIKRKALASASASASASAAMRPKNQVKTKCQPKARPAAVSKLTKSLSKFQSQSKAKIAKSKIKKIPLAKSESKHVQKKTLAAKQPQSRQALQTVKSRLPAGISVRSTASVVKEAPKPKSEPPPSQPKSPASSTGIGAKRPGILKRSKSVKKLIASKSSNSCRAAPLEEKRRQKSGRLSAGCVVPKPSRCLTPPYKKRVNPPWCHPYQFQGGAGAIYQPHAPHAKPKRKAARPQPPPVSKSKPIKTVNSVRRVRNRRSQTRLAKDQEREEAIDDPERLDAGSMMHYRLKEADQPKRTRRIYRISARLQELALPSPHRRFVPQVKPERSHPRIFRPKSKLRLRRRKRRGVMVDSSLGSIEGMRPTSRSGLSPAKRHLTLAFMNKDGTRISRSPRTRRSVLWR